MTSVPHCVLEIAEYLDFVSWREVAANQSSFAEACNSAWASGICNRRHPEKNCWRLFSHDQLRCSYPLHHKISEITSFGVQLVCDPVMMTHKDFQHIPENWHHTRCCETAWNWSASSSFRKSLRADCPVRSSKTKCSHNLTSCRLAKGNSKSSYNM